MLSYGLVCALVSCCTSEMYACDECVREFFFDGKIRYFSFLNISHYNARVP